ncbi:MAG: hypothetical protein ACO3C1_04250 [Ilumatobacteraceae bacterium]
MGAATLAAASPAFAVPVESTIDTSSSTVESTIDWSHMQDEYSFSSPITVRATLTGGDSGASTKVFERADVTVGEGVELDATDLVTDPGDVPGAVSVDIDDSTGRITVAVLEAGCLNGLDVSIISTEAVSSVGVQVDSLFAVADPALALTATSGATGIDLSWAPAEGATGCVDLGSVGDTATFDYVIYSIVYDVLVPDDVLPTSGNGPALAVSAASMVAVGLLLRRVAVRRPVRPR